MAYKNSSRQVVYGSLFGGDSMIAFDLWDNMVEVSYYLDGEKKPFSIWKRLRIAFQIIFHRHRPLYQIFVDREELFTAVIKIKMRGREMEREKLMEEMKKRGKDVEKKREKDNG